MKAKILNCNNFRNLDTQQIKLYDGVNVICGENAQGKTNLIEAIWLFTGAKSFRFSKDAEMVALQKENAKISLEYEKGGINHKSEIIFAPKKEVYLNSKKLRSAASLAGEFQAIIFSPSDLTLVWGDPAGRRRFIDAAICQIYPRYVDILKNYTRAVTQRNSVLKNQGQQSSNINTLIDAFDSEISVLGEKLIIYRKRYVDLLNETLPEIFEGLSAGREEVSVKYACSCPDGIANALKQCRGEDIRRFVTSVGPHRDDLRFFINEKEVKAYGSQGQKRSVCLAVKLAEAKIIKKTCGEQPIALLDDVMSELDPSRQEYLLNHIKEWQVFITCCDPSNIEKLNDGKVFIMENGKLKEK